MPTSIVTRYASISARQRAAPRSGSGGRPRGTPPHSGRTVVDRQPERVERRQDAEQAVVPRSQVDVRATSRQVGQDVRVRQRHGLGQALRAAGEQDGGRLRHAAPPPASASSAARAQRPPACASAARGRPRPPGRRTGPPARTGRCRARPVPLTSARAVSTCRRLRQVQRVQHVARADRPVDHDGRLAREERGQVRRPPPPRRPAA